MTKRRSPPADLEDQVEDFTEDYVVTTDRRPFWGGKARPENAVISGPRDDAAILAMLERGWIREAGRG